jgi:hypothetical protein
MDCRCLPADPVARHAVRLRRPSLDTARRRLAAMQEPMGMRLSRALQREPMTATELANDVAVVGSSADLELVSRGSPLPAPR